MGGGREGGDGSARPPTQTQTEEAASDSKALPLLFSSLPLPPEADVSNSNLLDTVVYGLKTDWDGWGGGGKGVPSSLPGTLLLLLRLHYSTFIKSRLGHGISYRVLKCASLLHWGKNTKDRNTLSLPQKNFFDKAPVERTSSPAKKNFFVWLTAHTVIAHIV